MKERVSIIIPVHNCLEYTKWCVDSIYENTENFEIILFDNGSNDGTLKWAKEKALRKDNFVLIYNGVNVGFGSGVNQAFAWVTGDYVCVLNNDVIVTENWLSHLLDHLELYDIVGPCSNFVAGRQLVIPGTYDNVIELNSIAKKFYNNNKGEVELVRWIIGLCMVMRTDVFEAVGGFDEQFGLGNAEDIDFCLTATDMGFQCVIAKDVFIHHFGHATFKELGIDVMESCRTNNKKLVEKWKDKNMPLDQLFKFEMEERLHEDK